MIRFNARACGSMAASVVLLLLANGCGPKEPRTGLGALADTRGSAAAILERDEMTLAVANMEELIRYRLPGVTVRRAGSRAWIEIRGPGTISSSTEALIIVDGVQNSSRGLLSMDPTDVERIQVLKDGSAAIYGIRAANGVVVVTTRRQGQ